MKGRIAEIFDSVQGEGIYLGEKQIFVRFFGCNLSCRFCDTKQYRFIEYEPEELFGEIALYSGDEIHSISFTGGEPLLQHEFLREILMLTRANGYKNYLETNGTLAGELERVIKYVDIVSMDVKLPSSSGMGLLWGLHERFLKAASQKEVFIKTIICGVTPEEELRDALALIKKINPAAIVILQPNSLDDYGLLKKKLDSFQEICFNEGITACIIPQMHIIMGVR